MDSDNDSYHFPKCQTHAYTRFENGCSENSTQKLLTNYSTEEIIKTLFAGLGRSVLGKTVPSVLGTQDLWHSFSQYVPPGRQITYISFHVQENAGQNTFSAGFSKTRWTCRLTLAMIMTLQTSTIFAVRDQLLENVSILDCKGNCLRRQILSDFKHKIASSLSMPSTGSHWFHILNAYIYIVLYCNVM